MIWRVGTGFLVGHGPYRLLDATGDVTRTFAASELSLEDDLIRTTFTVRDGWLIEHTAVEHWGRDGETGEKPVLGGLVVDTSEETARFVATVLGDHAVREEEDRLRGASEAEARIDAISGARAVMQGDCEAARRALLERVERWDDGCAADLLRVLIELVRADVPAAALAVYVRGCLLACFESVTTPLVEGAAMPSPLAGMVAEVAARVERDAEYQSAIDARLNAVARWQAVQALRACARMLGVKEM